LTHEHRFAADFGTKQHTVFAAKPGELTHRHRSVPDHASRQRFSNDDHATLNAVRAITHMQYGVDTLTEDRTAQQEHDQDAQTGDAPSQRARHAPQFMFSRKRASGVKLSSDTVFLRLPSTM
jgi:hypothetical protein